MNCKLSEETLGQRIKAQRIRLQMTQDGLAEAMCIPKSTISAYENDKVDIKGSVLMELSEHLHTTPNYLLGYEKKEEQDQMAKSIASILGNIQDEKVKEFLFKQIQLAGQMMG
jgi:transcriptional regulator with XRE-family HTH domain